MKETSIAAMTRAGIPFDTATALRRISMTLNRWHELECGTGEGQVSVSVERDEDTGKTFRRVQFPTAHGYVDRREPCADRETAAKKRLQKLMATLPGFIPYVQGDPRGCALYLLRPGDVRNGEDINSVYNRGIAVY